MQTLKQLNGKPKFVQHTTNDGNLRNLLIPSREPRANCGIVTSKELQRLKNEARILTVEERQALIEETQRKKEQEREESRQRKLQLQKCQIIQKPKADSKLVDIEREAARQNLYLLERSNELMQEQDERVKEANRLILAAKCRAVRNAQIAEKEVLEREWKDEQRRLDLTMERRRLEEVEREDRKKREGDKKKHNYIKELTNQMKLHETEKLIENERKREETKMMNKLLMTMMKEEQEKEMEKKRQQIELRDSLLKANEEMEKFRQEQKEAERVADLRVQTFMKKKQDEDEERERRTAFLKRQREQEIARMRQTQQEQQDNSDILNELNAMRIAEKTEQKWREKELEAARKKKEQIETLKRERQKQIEDLRRAKAVRIAKEERDFNEVARVQKLALQKEQEDRAKRKQNAIANCRDLLRQVNEKEVKRIREKQDRFNEGYLQRMEEQSNDRRIKEYLQKKMNNLMENKAIAGYVKDIENQLKLN